MYASNTRYGRVLRITWLGLGTALAGLAAKGLIDMVRYKTVYRSLEAIQVLEGDGQLHGFFELGWYIRFWNPLASPPWIGIADELFYFRRDAHGWHGPVRLDSEGGGDLTVHPNIGLLMVRTDDVYLLQDQSLTHPRRAFRFDGRGFRHMNNEQTRRLFEDIGLSVNARPREFNSVVDRQTERSGWRIRCRDGHLLKCREFHSALRVDEAFEWDGRWFAIVERDTGKRWSYVVVGASDYDEDFELALINKRGYRIRRGDYDRLRRGDLVQATER